MHLSTLVRVSELEQVQVEREEGEAIEWIDNRKDENVNFASRGFAYLFGKLEVSRLGK